jgi:hypothetical protein
MHCLKQEEGRGGGGEEERKVVELCMDMTIPNH